LKEKELLTLNNETKILTRQDSSLEESAELTVRSSTEDMQDTPLVLLPSVSQRRSGVYTAKEQRAYSIFVPVIYLNKPLMPTTPGRARRLIKNKEATPFFKKGIFCIRLNRKPFAKELQEIAVGIDPGSKKEGFTVKSESHTYLNIQADAITHVKGAIEERRNMRRSRRQRKTPCRKNKYNRQKGGLPPSTRARWNWKLRIVSQLMKLFPITDFVVEDIKAISKKGKQKWNCSFSPLEVGKKWFYEELEKYGNVCLKQGYETAKLRTDAGLKKTKNKLSEDFDAHCVDSWVLANHIIGGHIKPDNLSILFISTIQLHHRQLHTFQPVKGNIRKLYGGTRSLGFKRGSLVFHKKWKLAYIGGTSKGLISLHSLVDGKRLCQNSKPKDIRFLSYNIWKTHRSAITPCPKGQGFFAKIG
jgi:hypothetical protein